MKNLYKFYWDCRNGELSGLFIADEKEVKSLIGKEVYFGEVLGKYSDVYGVIEKGEITKIKASKEFIDEAERLFGSTICGYNPLAYLREEEE